MKKGKGVERGRSEKREQIHYLIGEIRRRRDREGDSHFEPTNLDPFTNQRIQIIHQNQDKTTILIKQII